MAVDYSILSRVPSIGSRIISGMEAGREAAVRNQLLQQQQQDRAMQMEDRRRQMQQAQQQEAVFGQAADLIRKAGLDPDDPAVLQQFTAAAVQSRNPQLISLAGQMSERAQKRQQERAYRTEYEQKYGGGAASAPMAANAMPGAAAPSANALAAPADPYTAQREQAMRDAASPNPLIANRGKMMLQQLPKLPTAGAERATPADLQMMQKLGYPLTQEGYTAFKSAGMRQPAEQAPTITRIVDPTNPQQELAIDARVYRGGGIGSPGVIGTTGKSPAAAATAAKTEQGQQQARDIIDTLRASYDTLDRMRAVPSTQRSAISNALSYVAGTGVGQIAGRVAGTEEQVERDVISSARNQILNAVKNATGMSAQQLNSNVEFTSWLRSLTDPTVSYEANQRILDNLEKFIASGGKYSERKQSGSVTRSTSGQAAAERPAPKGVDPEDWKFMTPEERKLWK